MGNYPVGQRGPAELASTQGRPPGSRRTVLCNEQAWQKASRDEDNAPSQTQAQTSKGGEGQQEGLLSLQGLKQTHTIIM